MADIRAELRSKTKVHASDVAVLYSRVKTYTVRFWSDDNLIETVTGVKWGTTAVCSVTPTRENTVSTDWKFDHWNPAPDSVTDDMDCYAQFIDTMPPIRLFVEGRLSGQYQTDRAYVFSHAFSHSPYLKELILPNLTSGINLAGLSLDYLYIPSQTSIRNQNLAANIMVLRDINGLWWNSLGTTADNKGTEHLVLHVASVIPLEGSAGMQNVSNVYVPRALVADYKIATNWADHADKIKAIEDYPDICGGDE